MTLDLERMINRAGEDLTLDRPVADVVARGEQLRGRRRRRATGIATATLTAAAASVVAVGVLGGGSQPLGPSRTPAQAQLVSFSGAPSNLSPHDLEAFTGACSDQVGSKPPGIDAQALSGLFETTPLAAEIRGTRAVAYFRDAHGTMFCSATKMADGSFRTGAGSLSWGPQIRRRGDLAFPDGGLSYNVPGKITRPGLPATDVIGVATASERVATARVTVGDSSYDAAVSHGVVLMWLPDGLDATEVQDATLTGYAEDGTEVSTIRSDRY